MSICNYKAKVDQNAAGLLAAILKQLVQARSSIAEPIKHLYQQQANRWTKPSHEDIFEALQLALAHYSRVYVVVNALDKCQDQDGARHKILATLRDLQTEQICA
ncbi:hypothetical protein MMC29_007031 [Sticta canariensis]|nr:hypothetical protein [Sticta canariensis]